MSSSYSLYHMMSFPEISIGEKITAPQQTAFLFADQPLKTPPRTEFTLVRRIVDMDIRVFECLHEQQIEEIGRIDELEFTSYIKRMTFLAYYHAPTKLFMMKVPKETATSSFSKMTGRRDFGGRRRIVNLREMQHQVQRFTGMYASVEGSVGVQSQALFGRHINTDPMYERALREGDMYYVTFDYTFRTSSMLDISSMSFGIGKDSTVVITKEGLPEHMELEVALYINHNLLEPASY